MLLVDHDDGSYSMIVNGREQSFTVPQRGAGELELDSLMVSRLMYQEAGRARRGPEPDRTERAPA